MVRALLGGSAIADRKLECGPSLTVLGMDVLPSECGVRFQLNPEKAARYLDLIDAALEESFLSGGDAIKLAGKLMWATQHLFRRVGRAVIKPIFAQKRSFSG